MTILALVDELAPSRANAATCPIVLLHRRQELSRVNGVLEPAAEMFEPEGEARLLEDLPQHRLALG